jgi:hypothetical protein
MVREFGLLNKSKVMSLPSRYPLIVNRSGKYDEIFRFGRLTCALDFDYFLEGEFQPFTADKRQIKFNIQVLFCLVY